MSEYRRKYQKQNKDILNKNRREVFAQRYRTPEGYTAAIWNTMNHRCGKGTYRHIRVKMTKQEWRDFAFPLLKKFLEERPDETPSVDRIDPDGDYSLDNIRIISYQENLLRSRFNLARFGIDENSSLDERLDLINKMFIGNCEALNVPSESALAYIAKT